MRVGDKAVGDYRKESESRRGSGFDNDAPKPRFVETEDKFPAVCVGIYHTRSKTGKWGVAFALMRMDTDKPEFIAYEAWNADQVHRIIVDGFGWDKGYENGLPENATDPKFNPEADIFVEMWEIVSCKDLHKGGKWVPGAKKRSPYVEVVTEIETYEGNDRAKVKWVNRSKEIGTDGPYYVGELRDKFLSYASDSGAMKPAKAWYQGYYAFKVRKAAEVRPSGGGSGGAGRGSGGGRNDHHEDEDIPF